MNIKKTISAIMSLSMILSSSAVIPVSSVNADDGSVTTAEVGIDSETNEEETDEESPYDQFAINQGSLNVEAPDKVFYQIGEELDLTGGRISGCGSQVIYNKEYPNGMNGLLWDNFGTEMTMNNIDASEFDNTKPGIYKIKAAPMGSLGGMQVDIDRVRYGSFYVMVVDGKVTNEDKIKYKEVSEAEYYVDGSISITPPDKTVYKVGEKLDMTGCTYSGSGGIFRYGDKDKPDTYIEGWHIDPKPVSVYDLNPSYYDMNQPGYYTVSLLGLDTMNGYDVRDNITYECFHIEVVDSSGTVPTTTTCTTSSSMTTSTVTTTTDFGHNDIMVHETDLVVADVDNNRITLEDGRKFSFYMAYSDHMERVKKGDVIEIEGGFHCIGDREYAACAASFKIIKEAPATTTVTTEFTGTKKSIIYTGAMEYDCIGVNTYPTQTVFTEGEEINTLGLNVKCSRYIPYERLGLNREEYEPQPEYDKYFVLSPSAISIIDKDGVYYEGSRLCELPAGKYTVKVDEKSARTYNCTSFLINSDISYDIEIKKNDDLDFPEKTSYKGEKNAMEYSHNFDQEFKGVAAYPEKTVYKEGEYLDLTGLVIKAKRVIPFKDMLMDASEFEEEPVYLKTLLPDLDIITITDSKGKTYTVDDFTSLDEGKYTVSIKTERTEWGFTNDNVVNIDFSYDVEINNKPGEKPNSEKLSEEKGDANMDGGMDISDAVLIMQTLSNPDKYKMTEQGKKNADIYGDNDGITNMDALQIQKILLKLV